MTRAIIVLFVVLVTAGLYVTSRPTPLAAPADVIIVNAAIYTVDPGRPRAASLAIRDGRVLAIGASTEVQAFRGAATTTRDGRPDGGWMPHERLTREQALRSFTVDAAFAAHLEADLGRLRPGKLADLVVLSQDIMQVPATAIPDTTVVLTMVGGRIVHRDGL